LRHAAASSSSSAPLGGDAAEEPSVDLRAFEEALEELVRAAAQGPPEAATSSSQDDPLTALTRKDTALQSPALAKADWTAEAQALQKFADGQSPDTSGEEKVRLLHDAFVHRVEDVRRLDEHRTAVEQAVQDLTKERDRCKKELVAVMAIQGKLEASCRELLQLQTSIIQENKSIVEAEKERQNELNEKFQAAMADVEEKMKAETDVREHFIKENEDLRTKLNKFTETYEEQERQLTEQSAVRSKEMDLARERLREYETKGAESAANAVSLEKKNKALQKTTVALRAELQSIVGKFDEFHESVNGSSQKHGECKTEIDGLSAQLKDLDAENLELKENPKGNELQKEKEQLQKQRDMLERLCGNLQKECADIRERLMAHGKSGGC